MQTADNVAKWFLIHNKVRAMSTDSEYITNLKLQKLLYYAQGVHMAEYGEKLFEEPIVAWSYGPVVESVYDTYKNNGFDGIKNFEPPIENFSEKEEKTLRTVDNSFGQYSAWKLVEMTHNETPWQSTPRNEVIKPYKIRAYFLHNYIEGDMPKITEIERQAMLEAVLTDACVSKEVTNYDVDAFIRESRGYE